MGLYRFACKQKWCLVGLTLNGFCSRIAFALIFYASLHFASSRAGSHHVISPAISFDLNANSTCNRTGHRARSVLLGLDTCAPNVVVEDMCASLFEISAEDPSRAWMTFLSNDRYLAGVLALSASVLRHTKRFGFSVVVTCEVSEEVIVAMFERNLRVLKTHGALPGNYVAMNTPNKTVGRKAAKSPRKLLVFAAACLYTQITYIDSDMCAKESNSNYGNKT